MKLNTKLSSKGLFKKKLLLIAVGLILMLALVIGVTTAYYFISKEKVPEDRKNITGPAVKAVPEPAGGDPALVVSYYQQAVATWKAGDKEKAKSLAQKGLDINEQLTEAQKSEIPNQIDTIYNLSYITEGTYRD